MIRQLKEQGSTVYLLSLAGLITYSPTDEELSRMNFPRGMRKKFEIYKSVYEKHVNSLEEVSRNTRTPIIDLRKLIGTPSKRQIFRDTMHINTSGSEVYGKFISRTIKSKVDELLSKKLQLSQGVLE